ncbi:SDR family NAD(P)-dependent oxidoreductase [Thalassovita taeanensis]|uniref:NAD(P)-dependent dehydrogenase, short-chain alcohol dehydrogenase family n=1 Tax=Thalassovita taeanensis TaxID=657014 RepID=A0A1H9EMU3_9RHOB|nr:SDR family NAD(P)-dependent oxidoreductase [Thalassovita taeanensis]SEQ27076.1 NAD(P)-dependent dehydrogenase, short-chain alcohol dehydrogenase family [Thalassovita taeanensis]
MNLTFDGKTALITGGGSGIGAACCRELAASGATVVVADMNLEAAQSVADEIGGHACAVDVGKPDQVEKMIAFAVEKTGALHLLVNNAGIGGPQVPVGEYPLEGWQQVMDVNLNGVFYGMRYAIPEMLKSGGGAIVNMSSIMGSVSMAGLSAYTAAKHALLGLTRAAAIEYSAHGIRVNAVGPAFINTPLLETLPAEAMTAITAAHPIGRLGTSEEVSALVTFLLSDRASFITGSYHLVDGAYTAQ